MAPAGIEPATFRFVAQHLNHCATAVPNIIVVYENSTLRKKFVGIITEYVLDKNEILVSGRSQYLRLYRMNWL